MKDKSKKCYATNKNCILWVIIVVAILLIILASLFIPCLIWNTFKYYKKTEFFGEYFGTVIGAAIALLGVLASLIFTQYQTNRSIRIANKRSQDSSEKADERTKDVIDESKVRLKDEKINKLQIEIMIVNYKSVNTLNVHLQKLGTLFVNARNVANDMKSLDPSSNDFKSVKAILDGLMSSKLTRDSVDNYLNYIPNKLYKDIIPIKNAIRGYKIFHYVYAYQIQNLFHNTPNTDKFNKQERGINNYLDDIERCVLSGIEYNLGLLLDGNENVNKCLVEIIANTHKVNRSLSDINDLSFHFGKNLEDYIKHQY